MGTTNKTTLGTKNADNMTDKDWATILLAMLLEDTSNNVISEEWTNFENDIRYSSRYFPRSELLDRIKELKNQAPLNLEVGQKLYRARLFDTPYIGHSKSDRNTVLGILRKYYPEFKDEELAEKIYNHLRIDGYGNLRTECNKELAEFFHKSKRFWGYNAQESDAPPKGSASFGRANAQGISYLYMSDNVKTAISEVRPHVGQDVSVATFRIDDQLKLYDFCSTKTSDKIENSLMLNKISKLFSIPKRGSEDEYYSTQYISEYIRKLGFDGLRFSSSLSEGNNIVLFATGNSEKKNYTVLNSKVYSVSNVDVQYIQFAPFK